MEITRIRNELSVKSKNGIGFLLSAVVIWSIITILFMLPLELNQKNIFMLFATGLMFPLSVGISNLIKADWKSKDNPLGDLGLYLNLAQLIYFPILFWGIIESPSNAIMLFAIITGAHFFPYGWFYNAKSFYAMAPIISVIIMLLGLFLDVKILWLEPLAMVVLLLFLILMVHLDYKKKSIKYIRKGA
ncbi:DUF7010 family protein [Terribacillus halophilus]|uniref:DUF7010 family protein n=1 Tax=Terribacillus halophilus TaxID=361279 RepID=UPI000984B4DE|nr:hypothetical protein [Terribacillus halophilus]